MLGGGYVGTINYGRLCRCFVSVYTSNHLDLLLELLSEEPAKEDIQMAEPFA